MAGQDELDQLNRKFGKLYYQEDKSWFPLPTWARFYLGLGASLPTIESGDQRYVVAIAVPTRAYVSSLIASGLLLFRSLVANNEISRHLERIKSLPVGTPVLIRDKNRKLKGLYQGCKEYQGNTVIGIRYQKGTIKWFLGEKAKRIDVLDQDSVRLPKHQRGRPIANQSPLVKSLIGNSKTDDYFMSTKQECMIIGPKKTLTKEITSTLIAHHEDRVNNYQGSIQDILRARQLLPKSAAYRTFILPSRSRHVRSFKKAINPYITIFDGAIGFLKWRGYWRDSNWVVILNRTERNFETATDEVNREYMKYHIRKRVGLKAPRIPNSVEVMLYKVSK